MVLLPQSYYEATLLQEEISTPCALGSDKDEMCLMYRYPPFPINTEVVRGDAGYVIYEDDQQEETKTFDDQQVLAVSYFIYFFTRLCLHFKKYFVLNAFCFDSLVNVN